MAVATTHAHHTVAHRHHRHRFHGIWDKLGIFASALCLIDCLVLPIASAVLISIGTNSAWAAKFHGWILPIIGVSASMAFYHSLKAHHAYRIVAAGATGFALLVIGELAEASVQVRGINWVTLAGSGLLIAAHLKNLLMHSRRTAHKK